MQAEAFLLVIGTGIAVMALSRVLDALWARAVTVQSVYYLIRAPGVVVHECSHILACLITGAKITDVVLFSKYGGSVTYSRPVVPVLGNVIISAAPLFCIPLVLAGCTWVFATWLGCVFPAIPLSSGSAAAFTGMVGVVAGMFWQNLVVRFNLWFLLYLFITLSLVLSAAPSNRDLRNAAVGLIILTAAGVIIFWSGVPWAVAILWQITSIVGSGFTLGLVFALFALVLSLPLVVVYAHRHR